MRRRATVAKWFMTIALAGFATVGAQQLLGNAANPKSRPAGVAGGFYPADPTALTAMMDQMLARATPPKLDGQIVAAVAPHAGYQYSGPVAAYTYAALKGRRFLRVVVIAPSHYENFNFTSIFDGDGYVTPLGTVPVDKAFGTKLARMSPSMRLSDRGHRATQAGAEHAIEVQLPWLQHVLGSFTLVPIVMGDQSYESSRALGVALARLIQDESGDHGKPGIGAGGGTLILVSSDMSHYHTYDAAEAMDHKTLSALEHWDYLSMSRNFQSRVWEACGGAPLVAAMIAAERLGANRAEVLRYANSGDVIGDHSHVVGYSADVFVKSSHADPSGAPFSLNEKEKKKLLEIARRSVEQVVGTRSLYQVDATGDAALDQERGAFVTLKKAGQLRGCIGVTQATEPLYQTVRDIAALASLRDPRFQPVSAQELPQLEYEVSVLSPLEPVRDVKRIQVGQDGLLIKNGLNEGLLLPQVAAEEHWNRTTFLEETCRKAGMNPDCWKDDKTDIFRFTAVVFGDHEPDPRH